MILINYLISLITIFTLRLIIMINIFCSIDYEQNIFIGLNKEVIIESI